MRKTFFNIMWIKTYDGEKGLKLRACVVNYGPKSLFGGLCTVLVVLAVAHTQY